MLEPLVSVVIAVRNGERFLPAAIQSVLAQGWRPLEILVVDGHSTDGTAAIAHSYPEIRYVLQANRGVADAYNTGIAAAQGEFVAFLSHDDLWTPDKLRSQMAYMLDHPEVRYTVARVKFFHEPGAPLPAGFRRKLLEGDHLAYIMETLLARKAAFKEVGGFDTGLTSGEDVDWFARARDTQTAHEVIPKVLLYKRVHDANLSLCDPATNQILLQVLRRSIRRKRTVSPQETA
jgi:glycosyltransferase involved in cell wall biosynthesis